MTTSSDHAAASTPETTFDKDAVRPGNVVAYISEGRGRLVEPPPSDSRAWLRVSRVDAEGIHGFRVHPEEWEREVEFSILAGQVEANGVMFRG